MDVVVLQGKTVHVLYRRNLSAVLYLFRQESYRKKKCLAIRGE